MTRSAWPARRVMRAVAVGAALCALVACAGVLGLRRARTQAFPHRAHVVAGVSCMRCHVGIDAQPGGAPSAPVAPSGPIAAGSSAAALPSPSVGAVPSSVGASPSSIGASVAAAEAALHIPDDATCLSCHTKPHDTRSCLSCHVPPDALAALAEARDHLVFEHRKHLGAVNGNCMRCHTGVADGDDHMRPLMATCFRCHDDRARDARQCDKCHKNLVDSGTLPATHLAHEGDWMREHGARAASARDLCESCHKASFCAGCHGVTAPALPSVRRFADPFAASVHRAGFLGRHSLEARAEPGACAACHTPDRCESCHASRQRSGPNRASPHPVGWVGLTTVENQHGREARRDPASCAGCHGGAGEALCVTCHAVGGVGGNPHPPGWSSERALTELPCRLCHTAGAAGVGRLRRASAR